MFFQFRFFIIILCSSLAVKELAFFARSSPAGMISSRKKHVDLSLAIDYNNLVWTLLAGLRDAVSRLVHSFCEGSKTMKKQITKLKKYQFLFEELVKRDFKIKYKRTILGMGWSILSPLLTLLVLLLVFTGFFGRDTPHYSIYVFAGNIVYSYFSDSASQGMTSLRNNAHIFTKANVPKYLFLLSKNVQTLINFMLTVLIFFVFCIFDRIAFTWKFILLLYPICLQVLFNIGVGFILSALFVFFRDIQYLWTVFMRLLMYMSAIFYRVDRFAASARKLFYINPIYTFIYYWRSIVIDGVIPSLNIHLLLAFDVLVVFGLGSWMYKKFNTEFLYYL